MGVTQEINIDTIQPLNQAPTNDTLVGADSSAIAKQASIQKDTIAVSTTTLQQQVQVPNETGRVVWSGWLGVGLAVCTAFLAWKIKKDLERKYEELEKKFSDLKYENKSFFEKLASLKNENILLKRKLEEFSAIVTKNHAKGENIICNNTHGRSSSSKGVDIDSQRIQKPVIKYATLQSPDDQGVLRFSERSMTDDPSPQKMFQVEINPQKGTGIYRINPQAVGFILSDLQMIRDFVKSFRFSGNPATATLVDKEPGKIVKNGSFWIVEEPLEIVIK